MGGLLLLAMDSRRNGTRPAEANMWMAGEQNPRMGRPSQTMDSPIRARPEVTGLK